MSLRVQLNALSGLLIAALFSCVLGLSAARAETAPEDMKTITVRSADHPGFSRVVFDWPARIGYSVKERDGYVDVHFDQAAAFDFGRLAARPLKRVAAPQIVDSDADGVTLRFSGQGHQDVHDFRDGAKIAIDFLAAKDAAPNVNDIAPGAGQVKPSEDAVVEADLGDLRRQAEAVRDIAKAENQAALDKIKAERAETARLKEEARLAEIKRQEGAEAAARAEAEKAEVPKHEATAEAEAEAEASAEVEAEKISHLDKLPVGYEAQENGFTLSFPWDIEVAAVIFKRGDTLWVVFERDVPVDQAALAGVLNDRLRGASRVDLPSATALRYRIRGDQTVGARRDGATWLVDVKDTLIRPRNPIKVTRRADINDGSVVFANMGAPGPRLDLTDPEVGDQLVLVPLTAPSTGVADPYNFAEFAFLESAQGLVVELMSDAVRVNPYDNGIGVVGGQGLGEAEEDAKLAMVATPVEEEPQRFIDFAAWRGNAQKPFNGRQQALLAKLAAAPEDGLNKVRWEMARFYVATDNAAQALGLMKLMQGTDQGLADNADFHMLRGIARYKMRRFGGAAEDLAFPALSEDPDAALWRTAVEEALGRNQQALDSYKQGADVLSLYDNDQRAKFQLAAARAALATGDSKAVERELAELQGLDLTPAVEDETRLLQAELNERYGDKAAAMTEYAALAADPAAPRWIGARAKLHDVELRLDAKKMTEKEAIDALEALRFAWRGDKFELDLMNRLGDLYIAEKEYRQGLEIWRQAVSYFGKAPEVRVITHKMEDVFRGLFLDGGADKMPPVAALALYYDYRELTPLGTDGDAMIRRLADRLVEVDLLDRAAGLLEHQVKYRLEGVAQASVAKRLAMIYLLDNNPEAALGALRATRQAVIPIDLLQQRKRIEARALVDLKRYDEAEAVLDSDDSREAMLLRSEIFWGAKRWPELIANARQLLGDRWRSEEPLNMDERRQILRYVIALSMSDQKPELKQARLRYGKLMARGPLSEAFDVITNEIDRSNSDIASLSKDIAGVDRLEAFLSSYRQAFKEQDINGS